MAQELTTFEQLYPIKPDASVIALTQSVLTWERNIDGKYLLSRALTADEREFLAKRRGELATALVKAPDASVRAAVSRMLAGFQAGKEVDKKEAAHIITQYILTLHGLPLWAIERACQKFSRGEITLEQIEGVNRAFGPSTAQLYQIASGLCGEFYRELDETDRALRGVLEYKPSPEEVERINSGFRELVGGMRSMVEREVEEERDARRKPYKSIDDEELRRIYGKKKPVESEGMST